MNYKKLLKWNLSQPLERRVNSITVPEKCQYYAVRGAVTALFIQIHAEIDKQNEGILDHWAL